MEEIKSPIPLFDTIEYFNKQNDFSYFDDSYNPKDIKISAAFLRCYNGSKRSINPIL